MALASFVVTAAAVAAAATPPDLNTLMAFHEKDQRYLLAKLTRPAGDVHVSLYVDRAYSLGGQN